MLEHTHTRARALCLGERAHLTRRGHTTSVRNSHSVKLQYLYTANIEQEQSTHVTAAAATPRRMPRNSETVLLPARVTHTQKAHCVCVCIQNYIKKFSIERSYYVNSRRSTFCHRARTAPPHYARARTRYHCNLDAESRVVCV